VVHASLVVAAREVVPALFQRRHTLYFLSSFQMASVHVALELEHVVDSVVLVLNSFGLNRSIRVVSQRVDWSNDLRVHRRNYPVQLKSWTTGVVS